MPASMIIFTTRRRSLQRLCFYRCLSVHTGGVCMVAPGGHVWLLPGGHAWLLWGACMVALGRRGMCGCCWGGVCGCSGGHAWLLLGGAWLLPGGHVWLLPGGVCGIWWDTEIRSMSGWHASYWNTSLFKFFSIKNTVHCTNIQMVTSGYQFMHLQFVHLSKNLPTEYQLLVMVLAYKKYRRRQFKYPPCTSQRNNICITQLLKPSWKGWSNEPKTICFTMYPHFGHIYSEMGKENKLSI